ncbi:hypothetical protein [Desertimonas flava]|uniref:hypothetical protein n=1 Tax=Desertimonas flava TaxID=2064846 RepID=UPI000E349C42|nr:hypothetical protein [Desertimonas flava]
MNRLAQARQLIVDTLEPVLPGRVHPYGSEAMPCIYLGVAAPGHRQSGGGTFKVAQVPVVISYDGADHAQIAGLDEVTAKVCDAIDATPGIRWTGSQTSSPTDRDHTGLTLTVEVTIGVDAMCPPDIVEAETPPPILERAS